MGWWWSSNQPAAQAASNPATSAPAPAPANTSGQDALLKDFGLTGTSPNATNVPKKVERSREEVASEELSQLIAEFQAAEASDRTEAAKAQDDAARPNANIRAKLTSQFGGLASMFPQRPSSTPGVPKEEDESSITLITDRDPTDISFEALADETLSCRTAFDYAFYCQSMGGQWTNVYRYGELRSCSHLWNEFWLCMRAKSYPEERRRRVIKQHNIEKAKKWKTGPSSEDIWDVRDKLDLDAPEPFKGDYLKLEKEFEEWKKKAKQAEATSSTSE